MRIAVDGTPLAYPLTGIGHYTRSLLEALAAERPSWELVVLTPYLPLCEMRAANVRFELERARSRKRHARGWRAWWFDVVLPSAVRSLGADLFWGPTGLIPFRIRGVPVAITVHDFVSVRYPGTMPLAARLYRTWNQRAWVRRSDVVMAVSRATADEARSIFGIDPHAVIHPGVDEVFLHPQLEGPGPATSGDFFLVLGTVEPRKNLEALLATAGVLLDEGAWPSGLRILVVGGAGWRDASVRASLGRLEARGIVRSLGYVPRGALPRLLREARALLMPSIYEGFGMPVAEAMAVGCPVVCSDIPPFREVAGSYPAVFHGTGVDAMVAVYRRLVADLPRPSSVKPAVPFTWAKSARDLARAFEPFS
jgi:glycosyltransferase involved in cell wall biosynthesis